MKRFIALFLTLITTLVSPYAYASEMDIPTRLNEFKIALQITSSTLNCRSGAGANHPVKKVLKKGDYIINRGFSNDEKGRPWMYVTKFRDDDEPCWVRASFKYIAAGPVANISDVEHEDILAICRSNDEYEFIFAIDYNRGEFFFSFEVLGIRGYRQYTSTDFTEDLETRSITATFKKNLRDIRVKLENSQLFVSFLNSKENFECDDYLMYDYEDNRPYETQF